jgi:hypothetical protein
MTATQASLIASFGQLNREWLQAVVVEAWRVTTGNILRIMSDERYTPEKFYVSMGQAQGQLAYTAVTGDMLRARYKIKIEAQSLRPLFEQLEKEDTLALVNYLIQIPEVNRREVIQLILRAFRVPNAERFLGPESNAEAVRAAQLENQFMVARMQDPGVLPTQDHDTHLRIHSQAIQDPAVVQYVQQQMQMNPGAAQMFQQVLQGHVQAHQQASMQRLQGGGGGPGGAPSGNTGKTMPSMRDAGSGAAGVRNPMEQAQNLQSEVRGNAQRMGQSVSINAEQN